MILVLQQKDHDLFTRQGDDLFMTKKIHLAEALCGFHMVIKHLDKRDLIVKYPAGQVIEPGKGSFLVRTCSGAYYRTTYKYTCKSTYNLVQIKS